MKHSTENQKTVRRDNTAWEIRQIQNYNSDQSRNDWEKVSTAPAKLAHILSGAVEGHNPFQFCANVSWLARRLHNPRKSLIQDSITAAIAMLGQAEKKTAAPDVAATVEAA